MKSYSETNIGRKRQLNQDYVFSSGKPIGNMPNLFIVADGMGGHKAGDYASRYTVETIEREIKASFEKNPSIIIQKAIRTANKEIRQRASEDPNLYGMGTTVVVATVIGRYLQVANVGDSRLYIANGQEIRQITRDHSLVEEMVRLGGIRREEARLHPDKNIITRAIGAKDDVDIDFFTVELRPSDRILMCSDGLTNMVEDQDILKVLFSEQEIHDRIQEMGDQLYDKFHDRNPLFVGVLNGCFLFMADLVRAAQLKSELEFIGVSSYNNGTKSSGVVQITRDLQRDISGRDIIVVEDILDSGNTLAFLTDYLRAKGAASVTIATLLDKPARREKPIKADYVGFEVPDEFVVGYGLYYAQQYRNMPYIGVLKPEVYSK